MERGHAVLFCMKVSPETQYGSLHLVTYLLKYTLRIYNDLKRRIIYGFRIFPNSVPAAA